MADYSLYTFSPVRSSAAVTARGSRAVVLKHDSDALAEARRLLHEWPDAVAVYVTAEEPERCWTISRESRTG